MTEQNKIPLTALISLIVPLCSVLGFCYAQGYYQELGCKWAAPLLSIQQLIIYSSLVSFSFALPFIIVAALLICGTPYLKIMIAHLSLVAIFVLLLFIGSLLGKVDGKQVELAMYVGLLTIFSSYIAETIIAVNSKGKEYVKFSSFFALIGIILTTVISTNIGQSYAAHQLKNKDAFFPKINDGSYGIERRLISAVSGNFLIANMTEGKIKNFRLISNIQNYTISKSKEEISNKQPSVPELKQ